MRPCLRFIFLPLIHQGGFVLGIGASLEFSAGSCEVDLTKEFLDWELVLKCTRPSIKYTKTPPTYVSEHTTASEFRTRVRIVFVCYC